MAPAELIRKVRSAGVVGAGGVPTWLKLERQASVVIANGTECEPLARADRGAMTRYPGDIAKGLRLAMQAVGAQTGYLALREGMADAASALGAAVAADGYLKDRVKLAFVPAVYPAGEDAQLSLLLTGKAAPAGGSALDSGVAVLGVRTLLAVAEAAKDQASTHQLVSVMGAVKKPATVWAPRGIALSALVSAAGGASVDDLAIFPGGPMRGIPAGLEDSLGFGVSLVVVLPAGHPAGAKHEIPLSVHLRRGLAACESCEQCTRLCPSHLAGQAVQPHRVMRAIAYGLDNLTEAVTGAAACTGCGLCTHYACPVGLAPSIVTMAVKRQLAGGGYAPALEQVEPRPEWADRRVPLDRLLLRLDLARYDVPAPVTGTLSAERVLVPTLLPSGLLAAPIVRDGHRVKAGQPIAQVPDGAPGVPVLASISGDVRLMPRGIEITAAGGQTR